MAGVPIKFRCFQCNQLLGVSKSKAGSVVACPKCATELIVPAPDDGPAAAESPSAPGPETTPAFLAAIAEGLPVELSEIRLEDIHINPDYPDNPAPAPASAPAPAVAPDPDPTPYVPPPPPYIAPREVARAPDLEPLRVAPVSPPQPVGVEPVLPPIKIEPPSLVNERAPRARDLVLPRSVVASWSLFVLLAQALAFFAGLLAGHYVWRVH